MPAWAIGQDVNDPGTNLVEDIQNVFFTCTAILAHPVLAP